MDETGTAESSFPRRVVTSQTGLTTILNPLPQDVLKHPYCNQDQPGQPVLLWLDEACEGDLLVLHERFAKRALAAYSGRNRNVFVLSDRLVVKIPRNFDGFADNDWEGSVSNAPGTLGDADHVQLPKTRLLYMGEIPVVFMQRVQPLTSREIIDRWGHEPDWVFSVDGGQVGVTRHGRLVAYDYGLR